MTEYGKFEKIFIEKAMMLEADSPELAAALRLYSYELVSREEVPGDIEKIKNMVESTSHILEKMYQGYESSEVDTLKGADKENYNKTVKELSVFISVMCVGSKVYENLDPVFSRDIMHAALDAAHFLISRQFKEADGEEAETNERDSVMRMSSRDSELDDETISAMAWAFAELLNTDKDIRNAYDHSLMAGMPQKMSRQKRYKLRLSDIAKRLPQNHTNGADNVVLLLAALVVMLDKEDTFAEEVKKPISDYLYGFADSTDDKLGATIAILALQNELDNDERLSSGNSQLIKVVEYNVIGANKKKMTEDEKTAIKNHIKNLESKLE